MGSSRAEKGKIGAEFVNAYLVPGEPGYYRQRIWPGYEARAKRARPISFNQKRRSIS